MLRKRTSKDDRPLIVIIRKMKYVIILCLYSKICLSQGNFFDTIYLNRNFLNVSLSESQKGLIAKEFITLKSSVNVTSDGEWMLSVLPKINLFAHSILRNDQKILFENSWRESALSLIQSYYHYLKLNDLQKDKIIEIMENVKGADTLKITKYFPDFPKDSIMSMLDSTQLVLEAEQQRQIKQNFENYISGLDPEKARDTAFERYRLELVTVYNKKHLQQAKNKIFEKLMKRSAKDAEKINEITEIYQKRVELSKLRSIERFYSQDSILIAPIQKLLMEYRYKRFALQPNLCVYWCLGTDDSTETKEEEEKIVLSLEYFQKTYMDILDKTFRQLKKNRTKLDSRIEAARPPGKPGTVVNIVAGSRILSVEAIAELLLVRFESQ